MLVELAIGDAYGAGFEYAADRIVREQNNLSRYIQHPKHGTAPGCYTDDTQMSIAVAEALLADEPWSSQLLARHFVAAFHRDPREGYAGAFYDFLQSVHNAEDFLQRIRPDSDKSGAAMRACPLGVLPTVAAVLECNRIQAAVTHNTADGIHAAAAAALMTHFMLYRLGSKSELPDFLMAHIPGEWSTPWQGKVGAKGWMSVRAAITAVVANHRLSELLRACIAYTGDVDTVATIALGAASCSAEYEQDLPAQIYDSLENGPFGRDYLAALERRLYQRYPPSGLASMPWR